MILCPPLPTCCKTVWKFVPPSYILLFLIFPLYFSEVELGQSPGRPSPSPLSSSPPHSPYWAPLGRVSISSPPPALSESLHTKGDWLVAGKLSPFCPPATMGIHWHFKLFLFHKDKYPNAILYCIKAEKGQRGSKIFRSRILNLGHWARQGNLCCIRMTIEDSAEYPNNLFCRLCRTFSIISFEGYEFEQAFYVCILKTSVRFQFGLYSELRIRSDPDIFTHFRHVQYLLSWVITEFSHF